MMNEFRAQYMSEEEIVHKRNQNKQLINANMDYRKHYSDNLDCDIYLYKENPNKRVALVFHFKGYFDLTIEGIVIDGKITHMEQLGLPALSGKYFKLTPSPIKCSPYKPITIASEKNQFNDTGLADLEQWVFQALISIQLDNLVEVISSKKYEFCDAPEMEPRPTWSDSLVSAASGICSYANRKIDNAMDALQMDCPNKREKQKIPGVLPHISEPHVMTEYDNEIRPASVIRFTSDVQSSWGLLFHFYGDDSFRTIRGVWHNNILMPNMEKKRPDDKGTGTYFELGTIEISPAIVKNLAMENRLNGAKQMAGIVTETDWSKEVCKRIGFEDKWDSSESWKYVPPPAYTVAPNRLIFKLPSSFVSS